MIEYIELENLQFDDNFYAKLCRLHQSIFSIESIDQVTRSIAYELSSKPKLLILLALSEQKLVGYKIGYEEKSSRFYSWLGGVDVAWRGTGIASELMRKQHEWCRDEGYNVIRTQTKNSWRDMLILNLRHGFDIIGTTVDAGGDGPKLILEKWLTDDDRNTGIRS